MHRMIQCCVRNQSITLCTRLQIAKLQSPDKASNDWTYATLYAGLFDFGKVAEDRKYIQFLYNTGGYLNWTTGKVRFHADEYCIGQTYSKLYEQYQEPKIINKKLKRIG